MLKIENMSCGYDNKKVIKNLSIELEKGKLYGVIGINGCGKSTLLNAISSLIKYTGSIKLENKELKKLKIIDRAKEVSYLSQSIENNVDFTVYETVILYRYPMMKGLIRTPSQEDRETVESTLKKLNLLEFRDRKIKELSGGQKQRVFLAGAIVNEPKILLLDEPTNHLDIKYQIQTIELVKKIGKEKNIIVVAVLHDLNIVMKYVDKVLLLRKDEKYIFDDTDKVLKGFDIEDEYKFNIKRYMEDSYKIWV